MVLELHVWGPAFTLPSIDAHCNACIAYFSHAIPRDEWRLVASSPSSNPTGLLPALQHDGLWIGGYANIIDYIKQLHNGEWGLDSDLDAAEKADAVAFSSLIESRGQELLDLSLFVSSENYNAITRPTYKQLIGFPMSWITPHKLRVAAKARTDHLGLSGMDIDTEVEQKEPSLVNVPEHMQRKTSSIISPESGAQIRLHSLATAFLAPLQASRGQKRCFLGDTPSSLDCLALGYLGLALYPDLPSPWLAKAIRGDYPQLAAFVHDMSRLMFGGVVSLSDAGLAVPSAADMEREARARGKAALPWVRPIEGGLLEVGSAVVGSLMDNIPVVSDLVRARCVQAMLEEEAEANPDDVERIAELHVGASRFSKEIWASIATVTIGLGLFAAFVVKQGVLSAVAQDIRDRLQEEEEEEGFDWGTGNDYQVNPGLANLASQMDFLSDMQFAPLESQHNVAEAEVEVDTVPDRTL